MDREGPTIVEMVLRALYRALEVITGLVGLTPPLAGMIIGAALVLLLLVQLVGSLRGRTAFTLEDEA